MARQVIRDLFSFLSDSIYLWPTIGLSKLLGRMDLQRVMNRLPKEYLSSLNIFIIVQGYEKKEPRVKSAPFIARLFDKTIC